MRIYLIGYMGCGKSTIGRKMAEALSLKLIDLDTYIEQRESKAIPEIFATMGEEGFRKIERESLIEVSNVENVVIATGGGAPCFFDNIDVMNRTGFTVFLDASTRIITERLMHSKHERPLIKGKSLEELTAFIDETLAKRRHWYNQAQKVLQFDRDLTIAEVMLLIK